MDDAYLYLAASLLPLALAPWLARLADRSAAATSAVDSFVAVAVGGLLVLDVLPHAYEEAGLMTLAALAVGFVLPLGLGHSHSPRRRKARSTLVLIAFLGLGLHATLDGLALFAPDPEHGAGHGSPLALAVILHRLPMALAIWWIAVPNLGRRVAIGLLAAIGAATVVGFAAAGEVWGGLSSPGLALLQTVIAGMLLHMVLGHHEHRTPEMEAPSARLASTVGAVGGVVLLTAVQRLEPQPEAGEPSVAGMFLALVVAVAPALLLAYLGLAALRSLAPASVRRWLLASRRPVSDEMPPALALRRAFSSEVQLPVLALSLALLGAAVTGYRLLSVLLVAGLAMVSIRNLLAELPGPSPPSRGPEGEGWKNGFRFGLGTEIERTMPWILFGLGIAAFLVAATDLSHLAALDKPAKLGLAVTLGLMSYLLGLGTTPVAAVLLGAGLGLGPVLVFLLAGFAAGAARRLTPALGGRMAWSIAVRMLVLALILGYALGFSVQPPDLHALADRAPSALAVAAALVLAGLTVAALYRLGFRGFLRPSQAIERWHEAGL